MNIENRRKHCRGRRLMYILRRWRDTRFIRGGSGGRGGGGGGRRHRRPGEGFYSDYFSRVFLRRPGTFSGINQRYGRHSGLKNHPESGTGARV